MRSELAAAKAAADAKATAAAAAADLIQAKLKEAELAPDSRGSLADSRELEPANREDE